MLNPVATNLPSYLAHVNSGRLLDFRAPLFKGSSRMDILIAALQSFDLDDLEPELRSIEDKEIQKVGPFSIMLPYKDREQSVLEYFRSRKLDYDKSILDEAVDILKSKLGVNGTLRPISIDKVYDSSTKSTNWGMPYFTTGKVSGKEHLKIAKGYLESKDYHIFTLNSVLGWRGQPNGTDKPKQRTVWIYPHSIVLLELMFQIPFLNRFKSNYMFAAWNDLDVVDSVVENLLSKGRVLGFDATAFDQSIPRVIISSAFDVLRSAFQNRFHWILDDLEHYFSTSGLITPKGVLTGREGSIPSGSGLTNLIGSLSNLILFLYVGVSEGVRGEDMYATVLGDDGVWFYEGITPSIVEEVLSDFSVQANPQKQWFSDQSVTYLQRLHSNLHNYKGVRSLFRTLNGMMSHERRVNSWNEYMESVRWIMQIEQMRNHPYFESFISFIQRGDRLKLGMVYKGGVDELFQLAGGATTVRKVLRLEAFPHTSRDPRGYKNFSVYSSLMSIE